MRRILITGASGFIGGAVLSRLAADPEVLARGSVRRSLALLPDGSELVEVSELGPGTNWRDALTGVDAVVHTAARVHVMREVASDPLGEFRRVNVAGTLSLARQAAAMGVERFVFLSSIKVNGEQTVRGRPFTSDDVPAPTDPYGVSKHEAEQGLFALGRETGMKVSVIRPVLVYGPGVKGNFLTLMRWLRRGIPLPFGAIDNRRSLVALENLVDLIVVCLDHQAASGRTFMVSDGNDLSTTDLLRRLAIALGRPARLIPVPQEVMLAAGRALGKGDVARRLVGSLQVDISRTREELGWSPRVGVDEALAATAEHFLSNVRS